MDPTTGPEVSGPSTKDCDRAMRTLLIIIWFLFGGLWLALGYALEQQIQGRVEPDLDAVISTFP